MHKESNIEKTDQELVTLAQADTQAFSAIVEKYEDPIRRYVRRMGCKDGGDVDDVLQEIFIKVFVNLNDYDPSLKFSSWLYRIAHNETVTFFRKKSSRPSVLNLSKEDSDVFFEHLRDESDFVELAIERHNAEMVNNLMTGLKDTYREAMMLRFLEDKSYTEISDILKIPQGTVATLINRGKKELKLALAAKGIKKYE